LRKLAPLTPVAVTTDSSRETWYCPCSFSFAADRGAMNESETPDGSMTYLGETSPLSQGVQVGTKALRIHRINGMEVRKKRGRGSK
jgi:hypothetical protein